MLSDYLPIVLLVVLAAGFAIASLAASALLRPKRPTPAKRSPYESGIVAERVPADQRFPVRFYLVAMLFIVFDIETIFLFPWAVSFRRLGLFGLVEMVVFVALVFVAYVYVWKKGGLDWGVPPRKPRGPVVAASAPPETPTTPETEVARAR